jgi:plastocyanin
MLIRSSLALLIALAACKSSSSSTPDGGRQSDAPGPSVVAVTCPDTVPLTVDAPDSDMKFVFAPASNPITVGDIVMFTTHAAHNVVPDPAAAKTDPGLTVNQNDTKCLEFTQTGTFGFMCGIHSFKSAITVVIPD